MKWWTDEGQQEKLGQWGEKGKEWSMRRILTNKVDEKWFDNVNPSMLVMMVEYIMMWDSTDEAKTLLMWVTIDDEDLKSCQHQRHPI